MMPRNDGCLRDQSNRDQRGRDFSSGPFPDGYPAVEVEEVEDNEVGGNCDDYDDGDGDEGGNVDNDGLQVNTGTSKPQQSQTTGIVTTIRIKPLLIDNLSRTHRQPQTPTQHTQRAHTYRHNETYSCLAVAKDGCGVCVERDHYDKRSFTNFAHVFNSQVSN
jgi:hypothetical protein